MIGSIYFANEEMSLENKHGEQRMYICAALWGMMGWIGAKQERRGSSCLLCAIFGLPEDGWLVWESSTLCCRYMNVFMNTDTYLHAHLHTKTAEQEDR